MVIMKSRKRRMVMKRRRKMCDTGGDMEDYSDHEEDHGVEEKRRR